MHCPEFQRRSRRTNSNFAWSTTARTSVAALIATSLALPAAAQQTSRINLPPGGSNWQPPPQQPVGGLVTSDMQTGGQTPASLVQALVGPGVLVSNITYAGHNRAAGTFSGGTGIIGFEQGIVLSSGNIASVVGPTNDAANTTTDNAQPGDADLNALVGGGTDDRTVLEFDFECSNTNVISFQYVFTSEEYDEYVDSEFNDVFAFFLNGQNIALVPVANIPVAINNVNCDNPYNPPAGTNCSLYITNDCDSLGGNFPCSNIATEMDGLTVVFSATGTLNPGPNHIKLAIADVGDAAWDSNVFIRGESFTCAAPAPVFDPPSPCGQTLQASVGQPFSFTVQALATNGFPNQTVTVGVTGSPVPLTNGTFTPPLPAGPSQPVTSQFQWTPTPADLGTYQMQFTATDQLGQTTTCDVTIEVVFTDVTPFCYGDGTGTPCPCTNLPTYDQSGAPGHGCKNSKPASTGCLLEAVNSIGGPNPSVSVTANDLGLKSTGMMAGSYCIFLQGSAVANGGLGVVTPAYDGILCIDGDLVRLGRITTMGGSNTLAGIAGVAGLSAVPQTLYYQTAYRNAVNFCTPATLNTSNALAIGWTP